MTKKVARLLLPENPLEQLPTQKNRSSKMRDRQFRDSLTRAVGAQKGAETQLIHWNRFNP